MECQHCIFGSRRNRNMIVAGSIEIITANDTSNVPVKPKIGDRKILIECVRGMGGQVESEMLMDGV